MKLNVQIIIQDTEDDPQRAIYNLNQICKDFNMITSTTKTNIDGL